MAANLGRGHRERHDGEERQDVAARKVCLADAVFLSDLRFICLEVRP